MLQQLAQGLDPLGYTCIDKLAGIVCGWLAISPCAALRRKSSRIFENQVSVATSDDFCQRLKSSAYSFSIFTKTSQQ